MAAAAANSEILEDISKVLQMLEEEITKIHKLCLLRRREIDCCIQQCRPLLKPWPLKSNKSEETTENTAKSSMLHQSESTVVQGTEITDNEAKEAERQDLAALDGLLAKAQKAREIQTKQGSIASSSKRNLTSAGGVNDDSKRHDTVVSLPEVKDGSSSATRLLNAQSIEIRQRRGLDVPDDNVHSSSLTEREHKPGSVTGKSPESISALRKGDCLPNSDQADKQEMFDPFGEGAELKLPIKYRRLKATTAKLYSELENVSEKRESPLPSQPFVQGIESLFDMGDIPTHSELQDKGIALLKEHEKLSKLTSNVVNRSQNLDDDSPWPEVYKCYRLWQIVLNKFNELQKGTQQLLEGVRNQRKILLHCLLGDLVCRVPFLLDCHLVISFLDEQMCAITSFHSCEGRTSSRTVSCRRTFSSIREQLFRKFTDTNYICS
ncbi:uncharacterized protein [Montipora foliosa]|uniref:uncharacterized protein n=1 Tax=Montipora foliosa TaxID=591990 RepID=UPI0035F117CF